MTLFNIRNKWYIEQQTISEMMIDCYKTQLEVRCDPCDHLSSCRAIVKFKSYTVDTESLRAIRISKGGSFNKKNIVGVHDWLGSIISWEAKLDSNVDFSC